MFLNNEGEFTMKCRYEYATATFRYYDLHRFLLDHKDYPVSWIMKVWSEAYSLNA